MRHLRAHRKLGRTTPHRLSMLRNLVTSFLEHERITTTDAKAKELRPLAERIITYGKRGDLHSRRKALRIVRSKTVVGKVFDEVARRFADRPGGYTRIIKLGRRRGDCAAISVIELLPAEDTKKGRARPPGKGKKTAGRAKTKGKAEPKGKTQPKGKVRPKGKPRPRPEGRNQSAKAGTKKGKPKES